MELGVTHDAIAVDVEVLGERLGALSLLLGGLNKDEELLKGDNSVRVNIQGDENVDDFCRSNLRGKGGCDGEGVG